MSFFNCFFLNDFWPVFLQILLWYYYISSTFVAITHVFTFFTVSYMYFMLLSVCVFCFFPVSFNLYIFNLAVLQTKSLLFSYAWSALKHPWWVLNFIYCIVKSYSHTEMNLANILNECRSRLFLSWASQWKCSLSEITITAWETLSEGPS